MKKIIIVLGLIILISGNIFAQNIRDNDLFYRCKDGIFHIRKDQVSIASVIEENGDIRNQNFFTDVKLYTIDLIFGGVTYYTIDRKNLSITNNLVVGKYSNYTHKGPAFNINTPTCIISDLETNERVIQNGSKRVKEKYENSLKF